MGAGRPLPDNPRQRQVLGMKGLVSISLVVEQMVAFEP